MRGRSHSSLGTIARLSVPYCQVGQDAWGKTLVSRAFCCSMPSLRAYINHASLFYNALLPHSAHSLSSPLTNCHPHPRPRARCVFSKGLLEKVHCRKCSTHTLHVPHPCPVVSIRKVLVSSAHRCMQSSTVLKMHHTNLHAILHARMLQSGNVRTVVLTATRR